jgi:alkylation response protein AidB-like acyl-CoA dehydrogenase
MDLDLTPEQELLQESVRGLVARHCPLAVVRELEDDPVGYSPVLWAQLAEAGLCGMTIAEEFGGSGMTMLDAVLVYEELGRGAVPSPHFVSCVAAAGVLSAAGATDLLPGIADGSTVVSVAWLEPERGFGPSGVTAAWDGAAVSGVKRHVPFASSASHLLVLCRDGADVVYVLVDPNGPGVTLTQQKTVSSDTQYRVDLDGAPGRLVGRGWGVWDEVMHDGIILLAAQATGGSRYALDITVQYAKDRRQFDKPLGAFQALSHYLSDAVTTVDGAETLVREAGWARSERRSVARLAPMAKLFACKTFRDVTAMAQQIFGGVGFTLDYDIQLYFRRAKQLQLSWWNDRYLEELVAADVLDGVPA